MHICLLLTHSEAVDSCVCDFASPTSAIEASWHDMLTVLRGQMCFQMPFSKDSNTPIICYTADDGTIIHGSIGSQGSV